MMNICWKSLRAPFLTRTVWSLNLPMTSENRLRYMCLGIRFSSVSFTKTFITFTLQQDDLSRNLFSKSSKNLILVYAKILWSVASISCSWHKIFWMMLLRILMSDYLKRQASQSKNPSRLPMLRYTAFGAYFESLETNLATFFIPMVSCCESL